MHKRSLTNSKHQSGASFFGTIFLLILLAIFLLTGLRIAPAYIDNNVIVNAMNSMDSNNDLSSMSLNEIRDNLLRTLTNNGIRNFDRNSVQLTQEGRAEYIDINYETRFPLIYNIEVVVTFENRFER